MRRHQASLIRNTHRALQSSSGRSRAGYSTAPTIPPFRIKTVEPITLSTREQRKEWLQAAKYNVFNLKSSQVMIDLLTDSGTGAMSAQQTSTLITGDESYAGASSFDHFRDAVLGLTGFKHVLPTHQGRAAERILFSTIAKPGMVIPSNSHFDTTRGNIEHTGARAVDLPVAEALVSQVEHPFKGNMDVEKLEQVLKSGEPVPLVMMTMTNNTLGGQPVSLANLKQVRKVCNKYGKPLFIDGARFAENAYFIKMREPEYKNHTVKQIVQEIFSLSDGMTMSAKKDGLVHMGGWLAFNSDEWLQLLTPMLILTEGFKTYGGLAGRDLDALALGLKEVVEEDYLRHRINSVHYLGKKLNELGVPTIQPIGGHAVFIDAKQLLPHIPQSHMPAQALTMAAYLEGGIRGCEIGTLMFGDEAQMELMRLAIPRRVYTESHFDYVVHVFEQIVKQRDTLRGYKISKQQPVLRHFTAELLPLE